MVSSSVDKRTVEENAVLVVIEAFKVKVGALVEVETSVDLELTLQGLALELDMKQVATKAATRDHASINDISTGKTLLPKSLEIAATQHIVTLCRASQIDGYLFC
ncbi:hypothetical protein FOTG_12044 [Fusarium oxysporum f. sp. vasinfectum 25433]|uniref:Uncharacterized protein n=1 Tax=Fusarium oxysporum f. sp. vasinfectum 25433 TaxID=1089449 RepID=X0L2F1_FUSOX|nr:hypothetical protein FOTG_12044 [Fusarium oxysporum f. sp. vasinfectum 25433]